LHFSKCFKINSLIVSLGLTLFLISPVVADEKFDEIDVLRSQLGTMKDKNSPDYVKTKQKLDKLVSKSDINYAPSARLVDVQRLISEQKFNAAVFELNDLIEQGLEVSKSYEILGDISIICGYLPRKIANYYKLALQHDKDNISASYKLSKLYFKEKKNILAIEYLRQTVERSYEEAFLNEIKDLILNGLSPQNKYEANNLYEILGDINLKLNEKEEMYEAYYKALQIHPNDIYLRYHLSSLLYENDDNQAAIELFNTILNENKLDSQIKISKAKTFEKEGDLLTAYKLYLDVLKDFPNSKQAKIAIFNIYKDKLSPVEILNKIYANKQNYKADVNELNNFAKFLDEIQEELAAQDFRNCAVRMQEAKKRELIALEEAKRQEKLRLEEIKKQKELNQKALKQEKKSQKKETKKNIVLKKEYNKTEKAEIKKEDDKKTENKNALAKTDAKKKKQKKKKIEDKKAQEKLLQEKKAQEKKLQEQEKLEKKAIEQERKKAIEKDEKKYYELKAVADNYLAQNPMTSQNYIAAANTYKQMGEPTSALKYYKEAMKLDPTNSDIYYNLGLTYFELNSPMSAKANLIKAINLDSENTKAKNLLAFVNQTIVTKILNKSYELYEKKDYIAAFEELDKGIIDYPNHAQMYYYRALIYIAMNRNAAAIIDLQKAIELDASHYMAYYQLGLVYEKIKDERSALVAYEKFLSIEPDETELVDEIQKKVVQLGEKYY